jgi:hypothetical protein
MMTATDTYATIGEPLEVVFSVWSVPKLYQEDQIPLPVKKYKRLKLGGGQAYDRSSE